MSREENGKLIRLGATLLLRHVDLGLEPCICPVEGQSRTQLEELLQI